MKKRQPKKPRSLEQIEQDHQKERERRNATRYIQNNYPVNGYYSRYLGKQ